MPDLPTLDRRWHILENTDLATAKYPLVTDVEDLQVAIFKVNEKLCATQRWCPHGNADLSKGTLIGDKIKCPKHGFMFRVSDGKSINIPGLDLEVLDLEIDDGLLKLALKPD